MILMNFDEFFKKFDPKWSKKELRSARERSPETVDILDYLKDSSTATAQATVAPTIGLLPIPISPIIST